MGSTAKTVRAMAMVRARVASPYRAAKLAGIALSTMYRSKLYLAWLAEQESGVPQSQSPHRNGADHA